MWAVVRMTFNSDHSVAGSKPDALVDSGADPDLDLG